MAESWWTCSTCQRDYAKFTALAAKQWDRMAKDPEAARVSGVVSLKGSTSMGQSPRYYAVNAAGESN